jgi:RNA polymerase sigma-70 factor (ECF subfamily)
MFALGYESQGSQTMKGTSAKFDLQAAVPEHYDAVYRFCARRVGPELASDLTQETFLAAQRGLSSFRGDSSPRTWLLGIALNQCRNGLRKAMRDPAKVRLVSTPLSDRGEPEEPPHETRVIDRQVLEQALNRLSSEHREVVLLHEGDGLTYEEAAAVLGVPIGTVKSRLYHAFSNLRRTLEGGLA